MKRSAIGPLLALAFAQAAAAQPSASDDPALETVIVTAPRLPVGVTPNAATHDFIQKYAAPAPLLGRLARWNKRNPLCPGAGGFPSGYDRFTVNRIKEIADMIGAPVSKNSTCKTNLAIIVTRDAQGLMGEIRSHRTDLLGYYASDRQADSLATMHFPVQVLYETATIDANGHVVRDGRGGGSADNQGGGDVSEGQASQDSSANTPGGVFVSASAYTNFAETGMRSRDGLESVFFNVTVVVDAAKVDQFRLQMGALADYFAMVALAQTADFTPCQQLPSISSLMTPNCGNSGLASAMTATDIAYLRGLYTMGTGGSATTQRGEIASQVKKSLTGEK